MDFKGRDGTWRFTTFVCERCYHVATLGAAEPLRCPHCGREPPREERLPFARARRQPRRQDRAAPPLSG